ncbi:MAG: LysO family transporter [Bacteroidales bacterium]|nr:LysO family transporter [Candidatus Cacconaster merdequi]
MIAIMLVLASGFVVGLLLRGNERIPVGKVTTVSICLLLFVLGLEVGSNEQLLSNIGNIGATAFCIALLGMVGSCVAVKSFRRLYFKLKQRDER